MGNPKLSYSRTLTSLEPAPQKLKVKDPGVSVQDNTFVQNNSTLLPPWTKPIANLLTDGSEYDSVKRMLTGKKSLEFTGDSLKYAGLQKVRDNINKNARAPIADHDFTRYFERTRLYPSSQAVGGIGLEKNPEYEQRIARGDSPIVIKDKKYNIRNNTVLDKKLVGNIVTAAWETGVDPVDALTLVMRESGFKESYGSKMYTAGWNAGDSSEKQPQDYWRTNPKYKDLPREAFHKTNMGVFLDDRRLAPAKRVEYLRDWNNYLDTTKAERPFVPQLRFFKEKGVQGYNPKEKDRVRKWNIDKEILQSSPELIKYLSELKLKKAK